MKPVMHNKHQRIGKVFVPTRGKRLLSVLWDVLGEARFLIGT